jgi:GntR family transcriptional regulator
MAQSGETSGPDFALDRGSDLPLGTQLAWRLRSLIASGRLREGDRLPGVREMAALAGVNVNTVRAVYARLADQGAIVSEHGRGTFVADRRPAQDELGRLAAEAADTAREAGIDPRELAAALYSVAPREAAAPRAPAPRAPGRTAGGATGASGGQSFAAEARRRAELRAEIAVLERELSVLDPMNGLTEPGREADARTRRAPQFLTAADLERTRDELAARLARLRADRTVVRSELERERHAAPESDTPPRQRAIASSTPKFESRATGWSLRWTG